jgi:hypothetical protein
MHFGPQKFFPGNKFLNAPRFINLMALDPDYVMDAAELPLLQIGGYLF